MVSNRYMKLLLLGVAILAISGAIITVVRKPAPPPVNETNIPKNIQSTSADITITKAHFTEMRDGITAYELIADKATYSKNGETALLDGINMSFNTNKGAKNGIASSKHGEYNGNTKNVTLQGSVVIKTANGANFSSERVEYNSKKEIFTTKESINFNDQRISLQANGMILNLKNETARFTNSVEATIAGIKQKRIQ